MAPIASEFGSRSRRTDSFILAVISCVIALLAICLFLIKCACCSGQSKKRKADLEPTSETDDTTSTKSEKKKSTKYKKKKTPQSKDATEHQNRQSKEQPVPKRQEEAVKKEEKLTKPSLGLPVCKTPLKAKAPEKPTGKPANNVRAYKKLAAKEKGKTPLSPVNDRMSNRHSGSDMLPSGASTSSISRTEVDTVVEIRRLPAFRPTEIAKPIVFENRKETEPEPPKPSEERSITVSFGGHAIKVDNPSPSTPSNSTLEGGSIRSNVAMREPSKRRSPFNAKSAKSARGHRSIPKLAMPALKSSKPVESPGNKEDRNQRLQYLPDLSSLSEKPSVQPREDKPAKTIGQASQGGGKILKLKTPPTKTKPGMDRAIQSRLL